MSLAIYACVGGGRWPTDPAGKHLLVVDIVLDPTHEVFDVLGRRHFGGFLEVLGILPEILESGQRVVLVTVDGRIVMIPSQQVDTYSSVAFISGQECGEQNSVIAP